MSRPAARICHGLKGTGIGIEEKIATSVCHESARTRVLKLDLMCHRSALLLLCAHAQTAFGATPSSAFGAAVMVASVLTLCSVHMTSPMMPSSSIAHADPIRTPIGLSRRIFK